MKKTLSALLPLCAGALFAQDRPNILWLSFEDSSDYLFSCYGNKHVNTPNIDSLATHGIQFMNAWSVAPQSSPARSSLITGSYATTFGMDIHSGGQLTPEDIFFPQLLRDAGYYCTNNRKTHYNTTNDDTSCWDEINKNASYNSNKRQDDQAFFAVFNTVTSHMGRVRTFHTEGRRDYRLEGVDPDALILPPHVPDLPEVRSDYAGHLEAAQDVDQWVGFFLDDLKRQNLDENTIIFVFSDHGGCLPRGKGYLFETGLRIPMVVYFPEKWKHLADEMQFGQNDELISFIDFGPTVLSLAGVETPDWMQGKARLGSLASKEKNEVMFAFGANQLHHYMPVRAATDGRYKYIRSYTPYMQFAARNYYQWGMPANKAWDKLVLNNQVDRPELLLPYLPQPVEMLFDLENDPFEINNLAEQKEYRKILLSFREKMSNHLRESKDLGFFIPSFRKGKNIYDLVHKENYPFEELINLVEKASMPQPGEIEMYKKYTRHTSENFRFWAASAFAMLAMNNELPEIPEELHKLLKDKNQHVRAEAALALVFAGAHQTGLDALTNIDRGRIGKPALSRLESITMHPEMLKYFSESHIHNIKWMTTSFPSAANEDLGLIAKGLLVNLRLLDIDDLYGDEAYEQGLKLNKGRRPMLPLP